MTQSQDKPQDILGELDIHLINEGRHEQLWDALGAHVLPGGGTAFRVWAPDAMEVQVRGGFNQWDGSRSPLQQTGTSGVWQGVVPEAASGDSYKFHIRGTSAQNAIGSALSRQMPSAPRMWNV